MGEDPIAAADAGRTGPRARQTLAVGLFAALRPRQWIENVLVLAAPLGAGRNAVTGSIVITQPEVIGRTAIAFIVFCLAASGIHLVNDALDVAADRAHPTKRYRPIAAGVVPVNLAYALSAVLLIAAIALSFVASWQLAVVIAVYVGIQLAYCLGLKHEPVLDICIVSSGFLLRAVAGGVAAGITLSTWFLLVMAFGSLFMAAGERYAELQFALNAGAGIRRSLQYYTPTYLRFVWTLAATAMVVCYGLWAFEPEHDNGIWFAISVVPFTIAVLRYAVDVDGGDAGEPEEVALHSRRLRLPAGLWIVTVALAIYLKN
ncbi:decaprenyl-phosphate phosphoribosyltransferase [Nocardia miyunensis]|uniref:decaprenyl-phosphate phosphoribosyltransferase n=1 Tax=Nocardia miyunensis TaxID=282684 RepID=UPI00082C8228|nr:decaprenyl-phosphate phosphoribosyltransferase [Nocardia miyunensis]